MLESKLAAHMEVVRSYRERLTVLQAVWDNLSLLSQMTGNGTDVKSTREAFEQLTGKLLQNLVAESTRKSLLAMSVKAQVAIDVMVRNLYERTADIGFLCADPDIQQFLKLCVAGPGKGAREQDAPPVDLGRQRDHLRKRFAEYVAKYSVYENIVLLAADGTVLLQLNGEPAVERCVDPLVKRSLTTSAAYVETFRKLDLFPQQERSLVYSYRVTVDGSALGVLCLCFRFDDETDSIFRRLLSAQDWVTLTYLDADEKVIASSDPWHIPIGATLQPADDSGRIIRFAGREYLAVTRKAKPYQGYQGPDWQGHALIPLEHAFDQETDTDTLLPAEVLAAARRNAAIFSRDLQAVPAEAELIQQELTRTVWNGHVHLGNRDDSANAFSKVLLWEISKTGRNTQEVFERSITELYQTVTSTILQDGRSMATLAADILDRNLYERANDCRWWALNGQFIKCLSGESQDLSAVTGVLRRINELYSVYHGLLLFDAAGRLVAVSNPRHDELLGTVMTENWVRDTLGLRDSQSYAVSPFEPSRFYDGQPTFVYGAAIRSGPGRVIGGIGIVFDSTPQLAAMLNDTLSRKQEGSVAIFATPDGRVLSATSGYAPGDRLSLDRALLAPPAGGTSCIAEVEGVHYVIGASPTSGYREYRGAGAVALTLTPLGAVTAGEADRKARHHPPRRARSQENTLELATFHVAGHWLGVPLDQVIEAVDSSRLHTMPDRARGNAGYVMHDGQAVVVADLAMLMGDAQPLQRHEIVIVRTGNGKALGLLIEQLGDIPQVDAVDVLPAVGFTGSRDLAQRMVRPERPDDPLLLIVDVERVADALRGTAGRDQSQVA